MKNYAVSFFLIFFSIISTAQAYDYNLQNLQPVGGFTTDTHYEYTWQQKLKRASTNLWSAPLEIKYSMINSERKKDKSRLMAVLEGTGRGFTRFGAGLVEFFTSPFDWPSDF